MSLGEGESPRPNVHFASENPSVYRYDAYTPDVDFIKPGSERKTDDIAESGDEESGNFPDLPKKTNASLFYDFLDHVINVLSNGSRFHCAGDPKATICSSCKPLIKILSTYVDVTTLEDIIKQRNTLGICGYICCNNELPEDRLNERNRKKSTYKIDLASKKVYKRSVYNSFCSTICIDNNETINTLVSKSPVETGDITPRAIRSVDHALISKLHDDTVNLPQCIGSSETDVLSTSEDIDSIIAGNKSESRIDDIIIKENNTEDLCFGQNNGNFVSQPENKPDDKYSLLDYGSENHKRLDTVTEPCDFGDYKATNEITHDKFSEQVEYTRPVTNNLFGRLGTFSMLWYLLSNYITDGTKELLSTGTLIDSKNEVLHTDLYDACAKLLPEGLISVMDLPIKKLLSTFNIPKVLVLPNIQSFQNLPKFDQNVRDAIAAFLLYIILNNKRVCLIEYEDSNFEDHSFVDLELESLSRRMEDFLSNTCLLDSESIFILSELMNDNI